MSVTSDVSIITPPPPSPQEQFVQMLKDGWMPSEIALEHGIHIARIYRAARKYGIPLIRRTGIANEYRVMGDTTAIVLRSKAHGVKETLIDTADLPIACDVDGLWHVAYDGRINNFYVQGKRNNRLVSLHRLIAGANAGEQVDHRNHDGLDNRRTNIHCVTTSLNQLNRKSATSRSTTGVLGVTLSPFGTWKATVRINGVECYLGTFPTKEAADAALRTVRHERGLPCQPAM